MSSITEILNNLFTPDSIARAVKKLPKIETPVMDRIYNNRPTKPLPYVTVEDIQEIIQTVPVIRRGAQSISVTTEETTYQTIEPMPVRPSVSISSTELNNLKLLGRTGLEQWRREKIEYLRRIIRRTVEGLSAVSLTGKISWPMQTSGAWSTYEIDFGAPLSVDDADWNSAKIKDVFQLFNKMKLALTQKGYGVSYEIWAGEDAYTALLGMCENLVSTVKIRIEVTDAYISVGNFKVYLRNEPIQNPQTKAFEPTIPSNKIIMISTAANTRLFYCAIDDLDANLLPMPFFVKPVKIADPSEIRLIAESKPLPVPVSNALCWCKVL